jgi:NADH dehydrogenase FAD-containing subunit
MKNIYKCIVLGGGASGFFFAINYAENHPDYSVLILKKSKNVLQKVKYPAVSIFKVPGRVPLFQLRTEKRPNLLQ